MIVIILRIRGKIVIKKLFLFTILLVSGIAIISCNSATLSGFFSGSSSNSNSTIASITEAEMSTALKEALTEGIISSTSILSKEDGYYGNTLLQILLPDEAEPIINAIHLIPNGETLLSNAVVNINRSAESAASDVMPIFESAITSMTITDAIDILKGNDTAATEYFKGKTYTSIKTIYADKINTALDKPIFFNISANSSWTTLVNANNDMAATLAGRLAGMKIVENNGLGDYATGKALDGLFYMVGEEEKQIREAPLTYAKDMIQKVFGALLDGTL